MISPPRFLLSFPRHLCKTSLSMNHRTVLGAILLLAVMTFSVSCKTNESDAESPTVQPSDPSEIGADSGAQSSTPYPTPGESATTTAPSTGYQKTYSGLQYQVIRPGTGERPMAFSRVKVHYHGTLPNGTVFDSSRQRGEPMTFGLNQVIAGWREGIPLMREGAIYRFVIPPNLAYGPAGQPPKIGPNQTLIFEVELLDVLP